MKFQTNLTTLLKNYNTINQGIYFKQGTKLQTISTMREIVACAELHPEDSIEHAFAIFSLPQFLSTLSLFKDPDLIFSEKYFEIKEGDQKIIYSYANPKTIISPDDSKEYKTTPENVVAAFDVSSAQLDQILKAASILKLDKLSISKKGVRVFNKFNGDTAESDQFLIKLDVDTESSDEYVINVDNLKIIPSDYTVKVEVRSNGAGFIELETTNLSCAKSLRYIIALSSK